jgi:two-component system, sensor histidine kinase RpfC
MNANIRAPAKARLLTMIRGAPRPEFEQALLRVVVSTLIVTYMMWYLSHEHPVTPHDSNVLGAVILFFAVAALIAIRIIVCPSPSIVRRVIGMLVDNAATTYSMILMGEGGALIIGVYLFVALGNGFRFGRVYLHASQAMACFGFGLVLTVSPFWSQHTAIGLGFLITLAVVPLYAGVLAERINEARKRADEANQAKGRFLANVSHEMRTPLNGVIAMADLLRETELSGSQNEIVETLSTSAQLLLAQIEDVLDISKIEAGRVAIECRPFDLSELLTSTIRVVMPQARYKGLALLFEFPPEIPKFFRGDAHHLRQVLLNLLANAVKFTESGQILLQTQIVEARNSQFLVRFEVRDTGIGIPQDKQGLIFEAFAQADDSITRTYGGTGLGTTIAKQLVSLMSGEIGVQSEVGAGSTFWFEIPLGAVQTSNEHQLVGIDASLQPPSAPVRYYGKSPANVSRLRGASILVAEDNQTNQRVTRLILESGGHNPTIVCDGEQALDALESGRFDLALFDLSMPVLSGIQALKIYRFTAAKAIPVLILSANVTSDIIAECQAAGCAEFVPKPLRASSLLDAIERHLTSAPAGVPNALRSDERPALALIDNPIVDPQVIEDLERLSPDPTFVERLVTGFRGDTDRILANIREALEARHFEEVKNSAHALKGGAGSVGAIQLMQLAARLEKTNHDTMRQKASSLLEELHRTTKQALSVLDKHLETRRGRAASGDFD